MQAEAVREAVAGLRAAHDALAALPIDALTVPEVLGVLDELEALSCQLPAQWHRLLARLQAQTTSRELGAKSWGEVLAVRWRLSAGEAGRRVAEAALLGPRTTLTGEPLGPVLPATAAAQALGAITPEHVAVLGAAMGRMPGCVDPGTQAQIEVDWVRHAVGVGPKELEDHANRILFRLDQDGPEPDDREPKRRRKFTVGKQRRDGSVPFCGEFTPAAWAVWEPLVVKFSAPGMCNPADDPPCVAGTPTQAQIDADDRSAGQRRHDALERVARLAHQSGAAGELNGLPVSILIRTTVQDVQSRGGIGVSGGGTIVPIADAMALSAAGGDQFLAVFDGATGSALNLFRAKRTASRAQRLMLIARDGGCTKPGCTVAAYGSQVHHAAKDWAADGNTNVDELGLACGCDNRLVAPGGWTTRINDRHEVEWIPPPHLDTGQARVNHYHRPECLLPLPTDPDPPDDPDAPPGPVAAQRDSPPDEPPETVAAQRPWAGDDPFDFPATEPPRVSGNRKVLGDPWAPEDSRGPDEHGIADSPAGRTTLHESAPNAPPPEVSSESGRLNSALGEPGPSEVGD